MRKQILLYIFILAIPFSSVRAQAPRFPMGISFILKGRFEFSGNHQGIGGTMNYYDSTKESSYEEYQIFRGVPTYGNRHLSYEELDTENSGSTYYTVTLDVLYDSITKTISSFHYTRSAPYGTLTENISLSIQNLRYDSTSDFWEHFFADDSNLLDHQVSATYQYSRQSADGNDNITLRSIDTLNIEGAILFNSDPSVVTTRPLSPQNVYSLRDRTLFLKPISEPLDLSFFDVMGKEIKKIHALPAETSIDLSDLDVGCYFIEANGAFFKIFLN